MKTQIIVAPAESTVVVNTLDLPAVGPHQVLVETRYSAISPGTELAFLHHKPNTPGRYPYYPGYSACGHIIEKGEAVTSLDIGQRVVCPTPHAAHYVLDAEKCHPVPEAVTDVEATVFSLASIALQGVRKAQIQLGWDVAVLGLGPIGNLAGQIARAAGATHVEGIDPISWRRELARECGFDAVAESAETITRENGFEAVIEATGIPEPIPSAFQLAKRLGHVILLGSTRGETANVNFYRDIHKKGLTVIGAHASIRPALDDHLFYISHRTDTETVLKLMAGNRIQIGPLVSEVVPPTEAGKAYERLTRRDKGLMLIAFKWK
jgi:2-desacetyl-2-hydroxyethyl bacteriochlorophyllide A dehydrogenase